MRGLLLLRVLDGDFLYRSALSLEKGEVAKELYTERSSRRCRTSIEASSSTGISMTVDQLDIRAGSSGNGLLLGTACSRWSRIKYERVCLVSSRKVGGTRSGWCGARVVRSFWRGLAATHVRSEYEGCRTAYLPQTLSRQPRTLGQIFLGYSRFTVGHSGSQSILSSIYSCVYWCRVGELR